MKTNFTKEYESKLKELYLELSFSGKKLTGKFGANELDPYYLLQETSLNTLRTLNSSLKQQITVKENTDEWSMTDYQQNQLKELKKWQEYVNLLIGYKLYQSEKASAKAKLKELRLQREELEKSTKTPEEQLKELNDAIKQLEEDE